MSRIPTDASPSLRGRSLRAALRMLAWTFLPAVVITAGLGLVRMVPLAGPPALSLDELPGPAAPPRAGRRIAVIVVGETGAELTDTLPPYALLAASGAFETYLVAPTRRPLTFVSATSFDSGLDFVPHLSFDEYDALVGRDPDLIVMPYIAGLDEQANTTVAPWVAKRAGPDTKLLAICGGSEVLLETGRADGREITTIPGWIPRLEARRPGAVRFRHDVRWHEDGDVLSSNAFAAGLDATLHAVDVIAGRDAALAAARATSYPHTRFLDDPTDPERPLRRLGFFFAKGARLVPRTAAVIVADGVDEMGLAAVVDLSGATGPARTLTIGDPTRAAVSRFGLWLLPRHSRAVEHDLTDGFVAGTAPGPSDTRAATRDGVFAYDVVLEHLAELDGATLATAAGVNLNYVFDEDRLEGPRWKADVLGGPLALLLVGAVIGWPRRRA